MATATLPHGKDPALVWAHLGFTSTFITRESDYLFDVDCEQSALDAAISAVLADDIEPLRSKIVARIKQAAGDHILATMPMWRQSNFHGRNAELSLIKESRPLTQEELAERAAMLAVWTWAKSVRAASDAAEAALASMTRAQLETWTEPNWPAFGA